MTAVVPDGPSAAAGLKVGDVITAIDGKPAVDADQLAILTITKAPGETVTLSYRRGESSFQAAVTLTARPTVTTSRWRAVALVAVAALLATGCGGAGESRHGDGSAATTSTVPLVAVARSGHSPTPRTPASIPT